MYQESSRPVTQAPDTLSRPTRPVSLEGYQEVLGLYNPYNPKAVTAALKFEKKMAQVPHKFRMGVNLQPTGEDGQSTAEVIESYSHDSTLINTFGGDGTINLVVTGLLLANRRNPINVSADGNANVLAHTVHSWRYLHNSAQAIRHGQQAEVRPIVASFVFPDGRNLVKIGVTNTSIGMSGDLAYHYNSDEHRENVAKLPWPKGVRRFMLEATDVFTTLPNIPRLKVKSIGASEEQPDKPTPATDDTERTITEFVASNGPNIAKIPLFWRWSKLFEPSAVFTEINTNRRLGLLMQLGKVAMFDQPGYLGLGSTIDMLVESDEPFYAQTDGEAFVCESGMRVSIGLSEVTVPIITTRTKGLAQQQ